MQVSFLEIFGWVRVWKLEVGFGIKIKIKSDEEIGKVAAAVPVLISRAIEMFMTRLLQDAEKQILQRNARTLTPQHIKQAINSHQVFIKASACRSSKNRSLFQKIFIVRGIHANRL